MSTETARGAQMFTTPVLEQVHPQSQLEIHRNGAVS